MSLPRRLVILLTGFSLFLSATSTSLAGLSATATISTNSGEPHGYTINLTNTGDTDIGTFWFAWTPPGQPIEYDFLPSPANPTTFPSGWLGYDVPGFPGYSLEFYNYTGSNIAPGETGLFEFTTNDSPSTLAGTSLGFPITTSVIYAGSPLVGTAAFVSVTAVPEPASFVPAIIAGVFLLFSVQETSSYDRHRPGTRARTECRCFD
jgi:hypothetical protein